MMIFVLSQNYLSDDSIAKISVVVLDDGLYKNTFLKIMYNNLVEIGPISTKTFKTF